MKPMLIKNIMNRAETARKNGKTLVPLFTGESGIGKSAIVQEWVREKQKVNPKFKFLDLRIPYLENPDLVGLPIQQKDDNGKWTTHHCIPEFFNFADDDVGLILFEEPNRATKGIMNCLMQILTDRKIHKVELPEGILLAACINPEGMEYDVENMDAALRNRFVEFEICYDHDNFVEYMTKKNFDERIQLFFGKGEWVYQTPQKIKDDGKYVSPRTVEQLNTVLMTGVAEDNTLFFETCTSVCGKFVGKAFYSFVTDKQPILAGDLLENLEGSLKKLKEFCKEGRYQGDMVNMTVESLLKNATIEYADNKENGLIGIDTLVKVMLIIPKDQAVNLLQRVILDNTDAGTSVKKLKEIAEKYPEFKKQISSRLKVLREKG